MNVLQMDKNKMHIRKHVNITEESKTWSHHLGQMVHVRQKKRGWVSLETKDHLEEFPEPHLILYVDQTKSSKLDQWDAELILAQNWSTNSI